MAKKKVVEDAVVTQSNSVSFEQTKEMLTEIAEQVTQIKVSDSTTLSIANQKMTFVNGHLKEIEAKRKELKQPFLDGGKAVDDTAKELSSVLDPALKHLKTEVGDWQLQVIQKERELQQKALEEARKKEDEAKAVAEQSRVVNYISQVKDWLEKGLDTCATIEHGQAVLSSMEGLQPANMMGDYQKEYAALIEMYQKLFRTKLGEFEGKIAKGTTQNHLDVLGGQLNDHIESLKEQIEVKKQEVSAVESEILSEVASLQEDKASNVAFLWKFDVVSPENVVPMFMSIDDKKIREWMNNNKENLKDGETIYGVKFYKEISVRTK
jgi:hypothetical protein